MTEEYLAPGTDEDEEDDWFGDGSSFGSGEELAAALFAISDSPAPERVAAAGNGIAPGAILSAGPPQDEVATWELRFGRGSPGQSGRPRADQELEWLSPAQALPPTRAPARVQPREWGMRQGVQGLKLAEGAIRTLQRQAIEVAWRAAAVAEEQRVRR